MLSILIEFDQLFIPQPKLNHNTDEEIIALISQYYLDLYSDPAFIV